MKNAVAMQQSIGRRDRAPVVSKLILALVFVLGLVVIYMGYTGMREYGASGFSAESAYSAIHALGGDTAAAWQKKLQPQLDALSADRRAAVDQAAAELLTAAWENQKAGGAADAQAMLDAGDGETAWKLLYATYLVNGPKVSTAIKKELAALSGSELAETRAGLLNCIADESAALPKAAEAAAGGLTGSERTAMLTQLLFVANGSADATDQVNVLKKGVRDKAAQLDAFRMIAGNEVSWLFQLVVSNSRTAILVGIILALDALLLTLLMMGDKTGIIDFK